MLARVRGAHKHVWTRDDGDYFEPFRLSEDDSGELVLMKTLQRCSKLASRTEQLAERRVVKV